MSAAGVSAAGWTLAATLVPALLAALLTLPAWRGAIARAAPLAPWPALAAAAAAQGDPPLDLPWLLIGVRVGVDVPALALLAAAAVVWTLAGIRLARERASTQAAALVAQTGSLGALVALDPVGFYLFFSAMTVASYGLVVADGSDASRRAGRIYIALALGGELLALAAFMLDAAGVTGTVAALLLLFGLGAKLGLPPFHVALPLAYAAAPPAGGAVIGSVLVNAAILGLARFLPVMAGDPVGLSWPLVVLGLSTAAFGAVLGTLQRDPKALLGYSTVSQMGILVTALGIAAGLPDGFAVMALPIALFALHHALVKAALFLGLEPPPGRGRTVALVLLSLALAAAPLTGGALAKLWIEVTAYGLPPRQVELLHLLLPLTSTATAVLMARFVVLAAPLTAGSGRAPFVVATAAGLLGPWLAATLLHPDPLGLALATRYLWITTWPLLVAGGILAVAALAARGGARLPAVPPGDVLLALERLAAGLRGPPPPPAWPRRLAAASAAGLGRRLAVGRVEFRLRGLRTLGLAWLVLVGAFALLVGAGSR